ncbi:MAG: TraR/DksA family transcriptional regulator [Acidobacteria bacterium]|nr:TraR/DksA family transcriptional regulator [Acidobacteriota bacterium]
MRKAELRKYKEALMGKREEILTAGTRKAFREEDMDSARKGDFGDQSSEDVAVYVNIHRKQNDAKLLRAVDEAILRIDRGNFGICTECGEELPAARLAAVPWTRVCVSCKESQSVSS